MTDADRIGTWLASHKEAQIALLAELVKVPSDNPPGDCALHGDRAAELLVAMGFDVERYPVPAGLCQDNGMISATNLVIRHKFGEGLVIALMPMATWWLQAKDGVGTPMGQKLLTVGCMAGVRPFPSQTS